MSDSEKWSATPQPLRAESARTQTWFGGSRSGAWKLARTIATLRAYSGIFSTHADVRVVRRKRRETKGLAPDR